MATKTMVVGKSYNFSTSAAVDSVTEFDEMKIKGILDFTSAMRYVNITALMNEWKNNTNINKLKNVDVRERQYYLIDNPNSARQIIVPDFLVLDGSITPVAPSVIELTINVDSPSQIDGLKEYLRVTGLEYTIK